MLSLAAMPRHAQNWVKLEEGLLYDAQSLRVNGSLRQVWLQLDPAPDRKGDDAPVLRLLFEYDGKEPGYRTLAMDEYTRKRVLRGRGGEPMKTDWTRITGVHEDKVLLRKMICSLRS